MEGGPSVEDAVLDRVIRVTSIAAMEAYSAPVGYVFSLNAGGRSGVFDVVAGDFSTELAADTENGIYIGLADDTTATSKVAKRRITDGVVHLAWFNPDVTGTTEVETVIQSAVNLTPDYGTLTYKGLEGTMLIDIPAVQSVDRRRGVYITHPMTLKGSAGLTTKVKDFCSAWLTYTGTMSVYQVESSDVTVTGVFVDANADNHYETDGSGNLWWETGPELKRPPNGISAFCPNGVDNLKRVVLENNDIYRPLGGISATGSLGSAGGNAFPLDEPTFLAGTLLTNLIDGIIIRNNTVRRARGNDSILSSGVINSDVYGNKSYNSMYHIVRFYTSVLNCHAYDNHAYVDYDYLASGYNATDLWYWRTDLVSSAQYLILRSGYKIGAGFTSTIDCSMTNNVIAYESNNPASSIIDADGADAASFQTSVSAVKNVQMKNNKSYRSPFLGLFGIALDSYDDGKDTEGVVFSGNEIYLSRRRQVLFQGNNYTVHDNYFEDCSEVSGGIIRLKGNKIRYFKNSHKYNVGGGSNSNNVFEILSTTAEGENDMFVSDNLIEGYTGDNASITDAGVFVHGSNIGIKPALENGWVNDSGDLTLYLNCAGQVSVVGCIDGRSSTSDSVLSFPGGYGGKENNQGRGVAIQVADIGDGTALAEVFPLRVAGSLLLDRKGLTASRVSFNFTYQAGGRLFS
jgi:hypothetical protein